MNKAFSLIELMVVIAIVGILAAVALPSYKSYLTRTTVSKAIIAQNDINDKIIEAYLTGKWICSNITSFNFGGTTYTINASSAPVPGYSSILSGAIFGTAYGTKSCDSTVFATTQVFVNNMPSDSGTEMVCILGASNGVVQKVCGVWDGTYAWQVNTKYLPVGYDCLISTMTTLRGGACTALPM